MTQTHVSLFDGSNAGLSVDGKPIFSVQYHPEASPGPHDSHYLFTRFVNQIRAQKGIALEARSRAVVKPLGIKKGRPKRPLGYRHRPSRSSSNASSTVLDACSRTVLIFSGTARSRSGVNSGHRGGRAPFASA